MIHTETSIFDVDSEQLLNKANAINDMLNQNEIVGGDRAKIFGAVLTALVADPFISIHDSPDEMVRQVNENIKQVLDQCGKSNLADQLCLALPPTAQRHETYRQALVETINHLQEINVCAAIDSRSDALGHFYETFFKFSAGAKQMGVDFLPRHITKFAVEVLRVSPHDKVFDPAFGTGGFLASALDEVRNKFLSESDFDIFKETSISGIERDAVAYGLAFVHMIFQGDGKSGIHIGDCFEYDFWEQDGKIFFMEPNAKGYHAGYSRPFTRVFVQPPLRRNTAITKFVDYALKQLAIGGYLFAILPASVVGGDEFVDWRKSTLENHGLEAVIKFNKNLYYPNSGDAYALILKANHQHKSSNDVFMGILFDDQHRHQYAKQVAKDTEKDNVHRMTEDVKRFLLGRKIDTDIEGEHKVVKLLDGEDCTIITEAYIDT